MRLTLADAAEIFVEAHFVGRAFARRASHAPFADHGRAVTGAFHFAAERRRSGAHRGLTFERRVAQHLGVVPYIAAMRHLVVGAYLRMSRVHARKQAAACRRRERCGRVHIRKADSTCGESVDVGRLGARLAVASEISVTGIVQKDEDHVRFIGLCGCGIRCRHGCECRHGGGSDKQSFAKFVIHFVSFKCFLFCFG